MAARAFRQKAALVLSRPVRTALAMTTDRELDALKRALRKKLEQGGDSVSVTAADLRTVLEELGRLHQSNERLRRQNRRVRRKLQRAGLAEDDLAPDALADGEDAEGAARNDAEGPVDGDPTDV